MDGNGRWAQARGYPRVYGHIRGSGRVKPVVREASRLGVQALTLYAFSTENWGRPDTELQVLWKLLTKYLRKETPDLKRENVKLRVIGEVDRLAPEVQAEIRAAVDTLSSCTGLELTFAVSYGARRELTQAARLFAQDCARGLRKPDDMDDQLMNHYLWTADLGSLSDVDLLVRTSGEQRISNFLLWQVAYAELLFLELAWPDFGVQQLREAVEEFKRRNRRFGGLDAESQAGQHESSQGVVQHGHGTQ